MLNPLLRGAIAGAAGTTALNTATYLDMVLRGRGASSTPEETVYRLSEKTGIPVPGDEQHRENRLSGLGAIMGILTGTSVGALYGAVRGLGWRPSPALGGLATGLTAMAGSGTPMTALGVTDPRAWRPTDWVADIVPHLAYGLVTAAAYAATERSDGLRVLKERITGFLRR